MQAYCSLAYTSDYVPGALVLGHRLKELDPQRHRVIIVTAQVPKGSRTALSAVWEVREFPAVKADAPSKFALLGRPELKLAASKINVWRLTDYSQVVYLDADTLPLQSLADLFEPIPRGSLIAASPDVGWPDIFNSGMIVLYPSTAIYNELVKAAKAGESFDGSDQGLLNQYFANQWHRLPFLFNVTSSASYQYEPAFRHYRQDIRVYHFIGPTKPWQVDAKTLAAAGPNGTPHDQMLAAWHSAARSAGMVASPGVSTDIAEQRYEQCLPKFHSENLIRPAPDRWDPTTFPPPRSSVPEASALDHPDATGSPETEQHFKYPEFGQSTTQLPWESFASKPERVFDQSL